VGGGTKIVPAARIVRAAGLNFLCRMLRVVHVQPYSETKIDNKLTTSIKNYEHLYSPVAETHYTSKVRPTHKQAKIQ